MQRLFTTFPNGLPGAALLLLRFAVGLPLVLTEPWTFSDPLSAAVKVVSLLVAGMLLLGIWTPLSASLQVIIECSQTFATPGRLELHLTRAAVGLALGGLVPGAWSIDARLYGRKRIDI